MKGTKVTIIKLFLGNKPDDAQRSSCDQNELLGMLSARHGKKSCGKERQRNSLYQVVA